MPRPLLLIVGALGLVALWYGAWSAIVAPDVARVKASVAHHYTQLRTANRNVSLEADAVEAAGFPFAFNVRVTRATLSMVDGDETFAVSIPSLTLQTTDSSQGTYRVALPATVEALYAKNGAAPEHYSVTMDRVPKLSLSAKDAKQACGPLAGKPCEDVAADAPLISYAVGLPSRIVLHMQLGAKSRDAAFDLIAIDVPIYQEIPTSMSSPLQLFVGILREALVFNTPGNEVVPVSPAAP